MNLHAGTGYDRHIPESFLAGLKAAVPISQVVGRYTKLTRNSKDEWNGLSPFRKDGTPHSFTVNDVKGLVFDYATGDHWDHFAFIQQIERCTFPKAVEHLALIANVPMPEQPKWVNGRKPDFGNPEEVFDYRDAAGTLIYQNLRLRVLDGTGNVVVSKKGKPDKEFRQRRRGSDGRWAWGLDGVARVPYRLPELIASLESDRTVPVFILEGEGKVELVRGWGLTATSIAKGTEGFAEYLKGAHVIVIPDNDAAGEKHAGFILEALHGAVGRLRVLKLPDLMEGEDIKDWAARGGTREKLLELVDQLAQEWSPGKAAAETKAPIEEEWPDPHPLPEGLLPVSPFNLELMPVKLRSWVRDVSERMQCAPDFVAVGVMASLGTVIGRKVAVRPMANDDWTVVANQWALIIGRPGVLKSPAMEEALRSLKRLAAKAQEAFDQARSEHAVEEKIAELVAKEALNRAREHLAAKKEHTKKGGQKGRVNDDLEDEPERDVDPETAIARARHELEARGFKLREGPTLKRYIVNDTNIASIGVLHQQNDNGLLVFRDELISLLDSLGQEDKVSERGFYLTAWSGDSSYTFDRIGRGLNMHIPGLCLSMLGGTQPGRIAEYVLRAVRGGRGDDGLIQRFGLSVWPDNAGSWRNVDRLPETAARRAAHDVFERLDGLDWRNIGASRDRSDSGDEEGLPYLRFSVDGYDRFVEWRTDLEHRLRSGELHPALESHLAKYRKLVPGLALISCLADGGARYVDVGSVERAISWARYLESHARRIYGSASTAKTDTAKTIVGKIKSGALKGEFSSRDVWRPGWSKLSDRDTVTDALKMLVEYDWLTQRKVETVGRPSVVYVVNPKSLCM